MPKSKRKRYSVDGADYTASVSESGIDDDGGVRLRVTIQAEHGTRAYCLVEGMVNRKYWIDYPDFDPGRAISITPRVVCEIIRFALRAGWNPVAVRGTHRVELRNETLRQLVSDADR